MKKKLLAAVFGAVLVLGACGGGDKSDETDQGSTDGDTTVVDAEAVVQQSCVSCHGGDLTGASGPALDKIGEKLSEEEIQDVIVNGQGGMPPGIIKDEAEVQAVSEWLAAKK